MVTILGIHTGGKLATLLESRKAMRDTYLWARVDRGKAMQAADKAHGDWLKVQEDLARLREEWKSATDPVTREQLKQQGIIKSQQALQLAKQEQEAKALIPYFEGQVKELNQRISHLNDQIVSLGDTPLWGGSPIQEAGSVEWSAYRYTPH